MLKTLIYRFTPNLKEYTNMEYKISKNHVKLILV